MRVALRAKRFRSLHKEAVVRLCRDILLRGRLPEARPAGAGIELFVGAEQGRAAARATVVPRLVIVPIPPGERALRPLLACDRELLGCQLPLPLRVGFFN